MLDNMQLREVKRHAKGGKEGKTTHGTLKERGNGWGKARCGRKWSWHGEEERRGGPMKTYFKMPY